MPSCQNCHRKWSWKQTFKRSFTLGGGMTCPYCETTQYLTSRARKRSTIIPLPIIALMMLSNLFFGPSYVFLFAILSLFPLLVGLYPLFIELSNKEEPLW